MLKKLLGTALTRVLNTLFNIVILLLVTNKIGSEGLGIIGLVIIDISIFQLVVEMLAGSSLIYFASRTNFGKLLIPAYAWIGIVFLVFYLSLTLLSHYLPGLYNTVIPEGYEGFVLGLGLLSALMTTHYSLLLGKERIKTYNLIFTLQSFVFLCMFLIKLLYFKELTPDSYFIALYFAYTVAAVAGFVSVLKNSGKFVVSDWKSTTVRVVNYGMVGQVANVLNIGNKRLSFYFVRYFLGLQPLGVYNAGIQLTEGLRIIGQSIAIVQFSVISNTENRQYAKELTIKLMKFSVLLTIAAVGILIIIPQDIYSLLLSKDFTEVKPVIIALAPGVVALVANNIFSHYFSGTGRPKVNLWSNLVGFVFTIVLAILLIPTFGIVGASVTASVSYISTIIYQYFVFKNETKTKPAEWIPLKKDFTDFVILLKSLREKK
jgi:O-antigen/teichoic acid export membrane protein